MAKTILIDFTFVNKKGVTKTVRFPFDEAYYKDLHDPSVPEEVRNSILMEYYKDYCDDINYHKHICSMPVNDEGVEIEFADPEPTILEKMTAEEEKALAETVMHQILSEMTAKQRDAFVKVRLEGKKKRQAALEMGIKENTFNELYKRAEESFERILAEKMKY